MNQPEPKGSSTAPVFVEDVFLTDVFLIKGRLPNKNKRLTNMLEDYNRAFLAYQRERMNRSARVVLSSRFFGEYIHVDGGARELRNELARGRDPDNPWEVDWLYRGIEPNGRLD